MLQLNLPPPPPPPPRPPSLLAAVQVFTCLFGLDIILNMFTGFFGDGGAIVETQPLILSAYCQGWFWIDLAASFP